MPLLGPALGPLIGGALGNVRLKPLPILVRVADNQAFGWRASLYFISAFAGSVRLFYQCSSGTDDSAGQCFFSSQIPGDVRYVS